MKNCDECKFKKSDDNQKPDKISWYEHQEDMARQERHIRRLCIALIVAIALVFASNALWLWAWTSYDYTSEEYTYQQDGEEVNIVGNSNEVQNGAKSDNP